ncbi:MAG: Asp-tRNA(Asn)/Glu-tRNA(Gln) amidotransferase subunit GatC [Defluviitaleaceae bacterium]|nr:Asp-tRNA(Asn)/Glu-tRNA(Gln) amidotransferase subunit GatC [Defluviitaleaceae bacterium]
MDIKKYESPVKLNLPDNERALISEKINNLLAGFESLETVDTSEVVPLFTVLDITNVMREDVQVKHISREEILSNAPEQYDGYFQAPKTLNFGQTE